MVKSTYTVRKKRSVNTGIKSGGGGGQKIVSRPSRYMASSNAVIMPGITRTGGVYGRFSGMAGELKYWDNSKFLNPVVTTWDKSSINLVPQGNKTNDRVGRKLTIKKINVRWTLTKPSETNPGNTGGVCTIMLLQDTQANGQNPNDVDVFQEAQQFQSFLNIANTQRFKVLYRKTFDLNNVGGANVMADGTHTWGSSLKTGQFNVNNLSIPIEFDASADDGSVDTIRSNNITLWACSRNSVVELQWWSRIRYTDY